MLASDNIPREKTSNKGNTIGFGWQKYMLILKFGALCFKVYSIFQLSIYSAHLNIYHEYYVSVWFAEKHYVVNHWNGKKNSYFL